MELTKDNILILDDFICDLKKLITARTEDASWNAYYILYNVGWGERMFKPESKEIRDQMFNIMKEYMRK